MSKKAKPQATEGETGKDLAAFDQLPEKTKDLMKLKEKEEKSTGPEDLAITRKIEDRAEKKK